MVTSGTGCSYQPSSMWVTRVTDSPFSAIAISASPSGFGTAATGMPGFLGRSASSGVPQIEVQMPQCASAPGLTAITPTAPFCSNSRILPGNENPSDTTILPRIRSAEESSGSWLLSNRVEIDFEMVAGT